LVINRSYLLELKYSSAWPFNGGNWIIDAEREIGE